jgi:hypothetical protein
MLNNPTFIPVFSMTLAGTLAVCCLEEDWAVKAIREHTETVLKVSGGQFWLLSFLARLDLA